ncbi:uncharacterized protein LOC142335239 isoform X1 [Convolutriloba macropyga]|uniref:uncharacterized protein LOC142335239 isoform X1 n=1 Tax=Convolutriloba macropyga TaxID=536237 RepID=UPI003F51F897
MRYASLLAIIYISVLAEIADANHICPSGYENSVYVEPLRNGGFPKTRCFKPLLQTFKYFYEIRQYCMGSIADRNRWDKVYVFQPKSRKEIKAMRVWLSDVIVNFNEKNSNLWLGFVRPRQCDGTGRIPDLSDFSGQWLPGSCRRGAAMNTSIFESPDRSNQKSNEFCTLSDHEAVVWDVYCSYNEKAYAVCELNMEP